MKALSDEERAEQLRLHYEHVKANSDRRRAFLHAFCRTTEWNPEKLHHANWALQQPIEPWHEREMRFWTPFALPMQTKVYELNAWLTETKRRAEAHLVGPALAWRLHETHGLTVEQLIGMSRIDAERLLVKLENIRPC